MKPPMPAPVAEWHNDTYASRNPWFSLHRYEIWQFVGSSTSTLSSPLFHDWELQLSSSFGGPLVQLYEFGGPGRYHDPDGFSMEREVRLLLAFPYLEDELFEETRLRKWIDQVVIPAISQSLPGSTSQYFGHSSVEMIRLNSQAARVHGMRDVPDMQLDFYLQPEQLDSAWKEIQRKSEMPGFEEFRGVRPVILANYSPLRFHETSPEAAFQKFLENWNSTMKMQYIPRDGFYIEFNTDGHLRPEVAPPDERMTPQTFSEQIPGKRKAEDNGEAPGRPFRRSIPA